MKKSSSLTKKLASYSALATTVLVGSQSSQAQNILYTDLDPDAVTFTPGEYLLDLNNDGTNDFNFNMKSLSSVYAHQARVIGYSNNSIKRDLINHPFTWQGYAYADTVLEGAVIGGSASFYGQEILASHYSINNFGNFWNADHQFMGLKLVMGSNTYYGWVRLSLDASLTQLTIHDYAVNLTANESILAGDTGGGVVICNEPTDLSTSNITATKAKLHWTIVPGALYYLIKYRPLNTSNWTVKKVAGTFSSKVIAGLSPQTNYVWKIKTVCQGGSSDWTSKEIFETAPLKIASPVLNADLMIYPNPTSGRFDLSFAVPENEKVTIGIYDLAGALIQPVQSENQGGNVHLAVDASYLAQGVYMIRVSTSSQTMVRKFEIIK